MARASLTTDGTGDYAWTAHAAALDLTAAWTIEGWINSSDYNGATDCWLVTKNHSNDGAFYLGVGIGWAKAGWDSNSDFGDNHHAADPGSWADNTWHHLAATWDDTANELIIYVDGVEGDQGVKTVTVTPPGNSGRVEIGAIDGTANDIAALFDEVRIWSDVRTPTEIADWRGKRVVGDEAGLVAAWHLDEDGLDATSGGYNLTLVADATYDTDDYFSGVTLVDSHTEVGNDPFTLVDATEIDNTAGNLQVIKMSHRSAPAVPDITDTSGTVNGDWIGPYDCSAEVDASTKRRSLWMWWRTVPSDAGNIVCNWSVTRSGVVSIEEYATQETGGTWRLVSNGAGGVLDNSRTDGATSGPTQMGASVSRNAVVGSTGISCNSLKAGTEGVISTAMVHRHGGPGNGDEHACTGFTIIHQDSNGSTNSDLSHAGAYRISTAVEAPAWTWSTTTDCLGVAHAFAYDNATPSSGTLATPTVKTSGNSATDYADGSTTLSLASFLPVAGRLYYLAVAISMTSDEDDFALDVTSSNGLNWVLVGWYPGNNVDIVYGVFRAQESSGLSNAASAILSYKDTGETVSHTQYAIIEIDGVDDSGFRGSSAHIQQRNPLDEFTAENTGTTFTLGTLTTSGDGHIAFVFSPNDDTGISHETDWTQLVGIEDGTPDFMDLRVVYDFTATPDTSYALSFDTNFYDRQGFIFAIKAGAPGSSPVPANISRAQRHQLTR